MEESPLLRDDARWQISSRGIQNRENDCREHEKCYTD